MEQQLAAGLFLMGLSQSNIQKAIELLKQQETQLAFNNLDYQIIAQTHNLLLKNANFVNKCFSDQSFNISQEQNNNFLYQNAKQLMLKGKFLYTVNDMIVLINNNYIIIFNQQLQQQGLVYLSANYKQNDELCILGHLLFILNFKDRYIRIYDITQNDLLKSIDILDIYLHMYQNKKLYKVQSQFICQQTSFFTSKNNLYLYNDTTLIKYDQNQQDFVQIIQIITDEQSYCQQKIEKGIHFNESILLLPLTVQNYICLCIILLDQPQNSYIFDANSGYIVVHSNFKMFYLLFQNNDETLSDDGYPLHIQALQILNDGQLVIGFSNATQLLYIHDFRSKLLDILYQNNGKFTQQISQESFKALNVYEHFCYSTINLINVKMQGKFKLTLPSFSVQLISFNKNIIACQVEIKRKSPIQKYLIKINEQEDSTAIQYCQQLIYIIDISSLEIVQVIYLNDNENVLQLSLQQIVIKQNILFFETTKRCITVNLDNMKSTYVNKTSQHFQSTIVDQHLMYLNDQEYVTLLVYHKQQNINIFLTPTTYLMQSNVSEADIENKQQKNYEIQLHNIQKKDYIKQQFQLQINTLNTIMETEVAKIVLVDNIKIVIKTHGPFLAYILLNVFDSSFKIDLKDPQQQKFLNTIGCNMNDANIQKIINNNQLLCEYLQYAQFTAKLHNDLDIQDARQFFYDFTSYKEVANRLTLSNIQNNIEDDTVQQVITFNEYVNKFDYQISIANLNLSEKDNSYINFNSANIMARAIDGNIVGEASDHAENDQLVELEDKGQEASDNLLSTLINQEKTVSESRESSSLVPKQKNKIRHQQVENALIQEVKLLNHKFKQDSDLQLAQLEEMFSETTYIPQTNDQVYFNYSLLKKSLFFLLTNFAFLSEKHKNYYNFIKEIIKNPIDSGFYQIKSCILIKLSKIFVYRITLQKPQNLTRQIIVFPLQKGYVSDDHQIILTQMSGILLADRLKYFQSQIFAESIQNLKQLHFIQYQYVRLQERFILNYNFLEALFDDARNIVDQKPKIYTLIKQQSNFSDKIQQKSTVKQKTQESSEYSEENNQQTESEYIPNDESSTENEESSFLTSTYAQTQSTQVDESYSEMISDNLKEQYKFIDSLTTNHLNKFSVSENVQVVQLPQDQKYKTKYNKLQFQQFIDKLTQQIQIVDIYKYIYYIMPELYEIRYGDGYYVNIIQQLQKNMFPQYKNQQAVYTNCQQFVIRQLRYSFQQQSLGLSRYFYNLSQYKQVEIESFKLQLSRDSWQQLENIIEIVEEKKITSDQILETFMELFTKDGNLLSDLQIGSQQPIDKNSIQFNTVTSIMYKNKHRMRIQISNGNAVYVLIILQRLHMLSKQYVNQSPIQTLLYNKTTGNNLVKLLVLIITSRINDNEIIYNYLLQLDEDYDGEYRQILFELAQYLQKQTFDIFETKSSFNQFKCYDQLWKKEIKNVTFKKQKQHRARKQDNIQNNSSDSYTDEYKSEYGYEYEYESEEPESYDETSESYDESYES